LRILDQAHANQLAAQAAFADSFIAIIAIEISESLHSSHAPASLGEYGSVWSYTFQKLAQSWPEPVPVDQL
jgi:hypothetical protein